MREPHEAVLQTAEVEARRVAELVMGNCGALGSSEPLAEPRVLTPTQGRLILQKLRPQVTAAHDLARARGRCTDTGLPARMPGEPPIYVGSGAHATDLNILKRLDIRAVLNCAPSVCKAPLGKYKAADIRYQAIDARDDRQFPLLEQCLTSASNFIGGVHGEGRAVLVHW